ncbi:MAG: lipoate--protein ligase family protein [Candidatus Bipolaricaulota bacterium]
MSDRGVLRTIRDLRLRDPITNVALEESIARTVSSGAAPPTVRFWRNENSAIIGRSQTAENELILSRCRESGVPVIRRPTGGGTVLHHPNNLNYSIYLPKPGSGTVEEDSLRLTRPVASALRRLGVKTRVRSNGLFVDSDKISGTAQSRRWGLLHHGTLLLKKADIMDVMGDFLRAQKKDYMELNPNLPSKPAPVTNLDSLVDGRVRVENLLDDLIDRIAEGLDLNPLFGAVSADESELAFTLAREKYSSRPWTYRFSRKAKGSETKEPVFRG